MQAGQAGAISDRIQTTLFLANPAQIPDTDNRTRQYYYKNYRLSLSAAQIFQPCCRTCRQNTD